MFDNLLSNLDQLDVLIEWDNYFNKMNKFNDFELVENVENIYPYFLFLDKTKDVIADFYLDSELTEEQRLILIATIYLSQNVLLTDVDGGGVFMEHKQ